MNKLLESAGIALEAIWASKLRSLWSTRRVSAAARRSFAAGVSTVRSRDESSMIASLRGRVLEKALGHVIVDVQGVGYGVRVPLSTFYEVGEPGADVALRIHTHVREDALLLYGFLTALEQQVFEHLITIGGIGPKLAIAVLSGIEPTELIAAVNRGDVARLTRVPGIGRKTSERIVLELKDKLAKLGTDDTVTETPEAFRAMLLADIARYAKVIKAASLKVD